MLYGEKKKKKKGKNWVWLCKTTVDCSVVMAEQLPSDHSSPVHDERFKKHLDSTE